MSIEAMKQALKVFETGDYIGGTEEKLRQAIEQAKQREWVGLTDEEIRSVYKNVIPDVTVSEAVLSRSIARAIEAKLKEKNAYGWQSVANPTEWLDDLRGGSDD